MAPDSLAAQIAALVAVLITAVATAYLWDRMRGRVFLLRPVAVVLAVMSAAVAGLVAVDREVEMFGSWRDLVGAVQPAPAVPTASGGVTGSHVESFPLAGPAS